MSTVTSHFADLDAVGLHDRLDANLQTDLEKGDLTFVDVGARAFHEKLKDPRFYGDWQAKFGDEAWPILEKYTGRLGR